VKIKHLLYILTGIGIVVTVLWLTNDSSNTIQTSNESMSSPVVSTDNRVNELKSNENSKPVLLIGNPEAPVTMIEYADFKCPSCNKFFRETGAEIKKNYVDTGKVKIEFRTYPFVAPDSGVASRGAYCAQEQGIFEAYHDKVFTTLWTQYYRDNPTLAYQNVLTIEVLAQILEDDVPDVSAFKECVSSDRMNQYIDKDLLLAADHEINGAPGFRIGEQSIVGPQNYNTFRTLLDIQLR
jgi:protein-disulfide isomerase